MAHDGPRRRPENVRWRLHGEADMAEEAIYYRRDCLDGKTVRLYKLTRTGGFLWSDDRREWWTHDTLRSDILHRASGMGGDAETFEVSREEAMEMTGGVG